MWSDSAELDNRLKNWIGIEHEVLDGESSRRGLQGFEPIKLQPIPRLLHEFKKMVATSRSLLALLPILHLALASPIEERATVDTSQHCGQWDTVTAGNYELFLDQWGISGATGSQCSQITSLSGSNIAWSTTWNWSGGNGVKTFSNIQLNAGIGKQLSAIKSAPVGAVSKLALEVFELNNFWRTGRQRGIGRTRSRAGRWRTLRLTCSRRARRREQT